ncbi:hypothetical protein CYY_005412 [Polysphondylium violaceum]|uniref:EF-hand domain-containing protein n=1 Tax=Polysphondylium violaceum TaxID=133409 RepID=A0A8J4PSZ5_9MYCE|nr:hypothetical protein CYY_005412 [Polysphondylium violaceum]
MGSINKQVGEEVKNFLSKFDKNKDHVVSYDEVVNYWKTQDCKDPKGSADLIFTALDKNHDGSISLSEFIKNTASVKRLLVKNRVVEDNLVNFLLKFNKNSDDVVTKSELEAEFERSGHKNPKNAVNDILYAMDADNNDSITMNEITESFKLKSAVYKKRQAPQQ